MNSLEWNPGPAKLSRVITCRVSKSEYARFESLVQQLNQTKSEFLRTLLMTALRTNPVTTDQAVVGLCEPESICHRGSSMTRSEPGQLVSAETHGQTVLNPPQRLSDQNVNLEEWRYSS